MRMVNFTMRDVRAMMDRPEQIRNLSVIAHVDHGKSTLTDSLLHAAGLIASPGDARGTDTRKDEQQRCITIKSTSVSLQYRVAETLVDDTALLAATGSACRDVLVNVIDSPGHVDFSSEVTAALRVTDGALVVVDCVEGVCVQTETVLRQALAERIKPVLFVNKVDRALLELQLDPEEAYQAFHRTIESVNVVVATYNDAVLGDVQVSPVDGTVGFGSGLQAWAFTLHQFARRYAAKFGVDEGRMVERLWGDNFFDAERKKWVSGAGAAGSGGKQQQRAFCQFCMEPIRNVFDAVMNGKTAKLEKMLQGLNITLKGDERALTHKALLKCVMRKFLPASDALLQMIVTKLPSPKTAQRYRAAQLYTGKDPDTTDADAGEVVLEDRYFAGVRDCDPAGPLVMYVSKMIPSTEGKFIAFGRVFSGRVRTGQKCRIMGPNYEMGKKQDLSVKGVQRTLLMMGKHMESMEDGVPCGNVVGLVGVDGCIVKSATLTEAENADCHPLRDMKYSVSPVVRVAVDTVVAADLPKLVEGLKRLAKADPLVQCTTEETGEHIVAGAGELHLEICLKDLEEDFMAGAKLKVSEPVVSLRETVMETSARTCLAVSANRHNRVYCTAEPLGAELCAGIGACEDHLHAAGDAKLRAHVLADRFDWDLAEARKVWFFGPDRTGPNVVVDRTRAVANVGEMRDALSAGFDWATSEGPLCGERMRGVRVNLEDMMLHSDTIHRGHGQVMPMSRRAYLGAYLAAAPALLEPVFLVDVQTVEHAIGGVYGVLSRRRGTMLGEVQRPGTPMYSLQAYLPVSESFGFTAALRAATSGQAFPQCVFDHWDVYPGNPVEAGTKAAALVRSTRVRKGLSSDVPPVFADFHDRI